MIGHCPVRGGETVKLAVGRPLAAELTERLGEGPIRTSAPIATARRQGSADGRRRRRGGGVVRCRVDIRPGDAAGRRRPRPMSAIIRPTLRDSSSSGWSRALRPRHSPQTSTRAGRRVVGVHMGVQSSMLNRRAWPCQTHLAKGGKLMSTALASCPVSRPNFVPRS